MSETETESNSTADETTTAESVATDSAVDDETTARGTSGQAGMGRTVGAALGEITWLLSQSRTHRYMLFVADLEWLVMPALQQGQYRLFYVEGKPAGLAVWGWVSDRAADRLAQGGRLAVTEWRSGPNLWLVDLIAPFGGQESMLADLQDSALSGHAFRYLRTHPDGSREVVDVAPEPAGGSG